MNNQNPEQSVFVTVVAWLFIIISGFAAFITLLQNIMFHFVFQTDKMHEAMTQQQAAGEIPPMAEFMFSHMHLFFGLMFVLAVLMLAAAIGLLLRKNWARITFIGLMIVGIVWNLGSLAAQQFFMRGMPMPDDAPADFVHQTQSMMSVMTVFSILIAVIVSVLFAWIAWKLSSTRIRQEFH